MKKILIGFMPVAAIVVLAFGMLQVMNALKPQPKEKPKAPSGLAVFTETARLDDVTLSITAQGEARPRRQVELSPQVGGRVTYVSPNLVNGGRVNRGDLLIQIEDADYKLAAVRAESSVASAKQALVRAEAEAEIARQELEDLGIENPSQLALREPQLAEARASLDAARAQADDAALQLARTKIYAPFDGLIVEKSVDLGQNVQVGRALGLIYAIDVIEVQLPIANSDLGIIGLPIAFNASQSKPGPKVTLEADIGGVSRKWIGEVKRTGAAVDSQTRLVSVFAEVEDPFGKGADDGAPLAPGLFVTATIEGRTVEDVVITPREALRGLDQMYVVESQPETAADRQNRLDREQSEAIQELQQTAKTASRALGIEVSSRQLEEQREKIRERFDKLREEDIEGEQMIETLHIREVVVLRSDEDHVYVTAGLEPGENVVISPVQAALDGMKVRTITSAEAEGGEEDEQITAQSTPLDGVALNGAN